jgi:hypothetical protein
VSMSKMKAKAKVSSVTAPCPKPLLWKRRIANLAGWPPKKRSSAKTALDVAVYAANAYRDILLTQRAMLKKAGLTADGGLGGPMPPN